MTVPRRKMVLSVLAMALVAALANAAASATPEAAATSSENPLDALRAYRYLEQLCAFGPRYSGSPGQGEQAALVEHFKKLGGQVSLQEFRAKNPLGGTVPMANIIVQWHPQRKDRILLAAHYDTRPPAGPARGPPLIAQCPPGRKPRSLLATHSDTRPLPDRDPNPIARQQGTFVGASDGASGTAALMELAHLMPGLDSKYGVDFVLFHGEGLG